MRCDDSDPAGFHDWAGVEDALVHEEWDWILVRRDPLPAVSLYTPGGGVLGVHDADITSSERAELCRWGFAPMRHPEEGRFWLWRPPGDSRRRPGSELGWGVARERDRVLLKVLRDLLRAEPEDLSLVLRFREQTA